MSDLDAAIEHGLRRSAVFNNRGVIHAVSGDSQAEPALADLNQAIKLGPPRAEVYNNRGVVHVSRGELKKAVADLDEAIRIYPEFVIAYANRAITLAQLGELDAALADVQTIVDLAAHPSGGIEVTRLFESSSADTVGIEWITVSETDSESLRGFRDEAARLLRVAEDDAAEEQGTNVTQEKGGR